MDEQTASTSRTLVDNAKSGSSSANANSHFSMNGEKNHELLHTVYKYLQKQMNGNQTLTASQKESLEVASHCLGYAFQFFEFDRVEHDLDEMFEFFEKHKRDYIKKERDYEEIRVSADDKIKANEYKEKGNKLMREEKFTEALELYEKASRLNPTEPVLYCNRAAAHSNLNKYKEAVEDCNKAISLDKSYAKAYMRRALAYEKLKDYKRALKSYKKACHLEPQNEQYKNLYTDANKRLKQRQDGSTSTSTSTGVGPSIHVQSLESNMIAEFDEMFETLLQWPAQQMHNSSEEPFD